MKQLEAEKERILVALRKQKADAQKWIRRQRIRIEAQVSVLERTYMQ
jgi:hypothetical protein